MRFRNAILLGCLILALAAKSSSQTKNRSVVLPGSAAHMLEHLCSRSGPPRFDDTWQPLEADVRSMESRLSRISQLRSQVGGVGIGIKNPDRYYRQYVGVLVGKHKFIFINAFCNERPPPDWRRRPVDKCDGGCDWGVVYDTISGEFSDLQINGVA